MTLPYTYIKPELSAEKRMYTRRKSLSPIKGATEPALKELLKNLEKDQIQTLRKAIESRGEHQTSCIVHSPDTKSF